MNKFKILISIGCIMTFGGSVYLAKIYGEKRGRKIQFELDESLLDQQQGIIKYYEKEMKKAKKAKKTEKEDK